MNPGTSSAGERRVLEFSEETIMHRTPHSTDTWTTDRRAFLTHSATAAATTALGALAPARFAHAAGSDTFKVGLIGCGRRGTGAVLECLGTNPDTVLWAAADVFPERVEQLIQAVTPRLQQQIQVAPERQFVGLDGYRGVIDTCDVVLVICACRFIPDYALEAIKAKKHVFFEKTAGVDVAGVKKVLEMHELSKRHGVSAVTGFCYRFHPARREAVQRIQDGQIGDIVAIQCDYLRSPYYLLDRNPAWSELEYQLRNWSYFTWLGGDEIPKSLSHNIDSALWTLGDQLLPEAAYGVGGRATHFEPRWGTSFDHHQVVYEFASGLCLYGQCRNTADCYNSNKDIYHGTKGRCHYRTFGAPYISDFDGNVVWQADEQSARISAYEQEHIDLFHSIRTGKPLHQAESMAHSTLACVLGQLAVYTGKRLTWKELLDSNFAYPPHEPITWDTVPPVQPEADGLYPIAVPGKSTLETLRG
jgi:myo-inositol 2-dehydrogenase / D-chiro-inositol 1-dehydrogenase